MTKVSKNTDFRTWVIQWVARWISTLSIVFILLICINTAIAGDQWREAPLSILINLYLFPIYFAILAGWAIAWQREETGGVLLTIAGAVAIIMSILHNEPGHYWVTLIIGVPFLLSGILFIICWRRIRKMNAAQHEAIAEGRKMNDKPKDRTTKRMNIIAIILVLITALGNLIYRIVTGEGGIAALFYLCIVSLVIALRREAVAGVFFLIFGLLAIIFVGTGVFTGEYESLRYEIFSLIWFGLIPLIAGLLFLAIWRRKRKAKVSTRSD